MIRESILELAAAARPEDRQALILACLESALLKSFHDSAVYSSICLCGESAARYYLHAKPLQILENTGWGELSFKLLDRKGYAPERWLFKAQRYIRFMNLDTRIAFTRKANLHVGWIRAPGLAAEAGIALGKGVELGIKILIDPNLSATPLACIPAQIEGWGEYYSLIMERSLS